MSKQPHHSAFSSDLFHPRYWLTWLGLGIFYLLVQLPYAWLLSIGRSLGKLLYKINPKYSRIAKINLQLCFPEMSEQARDELLRKHLVSFATGILEMGMGWWWSKKRLLKFKHFEGLENLETVAKQNRGVIILSAHFTSIQICARMMGLTYPFNTIYREQRNRVIAALLHYYENRDFQKRIHRHDVRQTLKVLKNKEILWYALDQDYGTKHGVFAPFFGVPAATITMPNRYAKNANAAVIFGSYQRLANGKGYKLLLTPPVENYPSDDDVYDATRYNQFLEQAILANPEQYWWGYKRFRTRPQGEKEVY